MSFSIVFLSHKKLLRLILSVIVLGVVITLIKQAGKSLNSRETFIGKQANYVVKPYQQTDHFPAIDSLYRLYGKNKILVKKYELQTLLALSHYPELREIPVHFYEEEALMPLASRPAPLSLFKPKNKWQYNIFISTKSMETLEPVLLKNLPFNAQVGLIGHELAHTAYYQDKNVWQLLLIGLNYPFPGFRSNFEKNTDRRAIAHGLGWQLLAYALYARKIKSYDDTYLGSKFYLSPDEIQQQISQTY